MLRLLFTVWLSGMFFIGQAQHPLVTGNWKGILVREDSREVVFLFSLKKVQQHYQLTVQNAAEELIVPGLIQKNDSLFFEMPFFESAFRVHVEADGHWSGQLVKGTSANTQVWPFRAYPHSGPRFPVNRVATSNITGRWKVTITRPNNTERPAVAEFAQQGSMLTGTFLTPSGDYRYLEGVVSGDSLYLSAFDGSHIYLFTARISDAETVSGGWFYSGFNGKEPWRAVKDPEATLPDLGYTPSLKPGYENLQFAFPDLDSTIVSLTDARFQGKVVVVQIMGSWCPNCMDETAFLSEYYNQNKDRGVEIVSLAYEYSTDFQRSRRSLQKFRERLKVNYPILITGVRSSDSLRTEKTLPQITPIRVFPTTIFIGKDGKVRKIESGFSGPGTGSHFLVYKKEFEATIAVLLEE